MKGTVPQDWTKVTKRKENKNNYRNYREIILLNLPAKGYSQKLIERLHKIT